MEILYRAAKQDTLKDGGITFQGHPRFKAIFATLVNMSIQVKHLLAFKLLLLIIRLVKCTQSILGFCCEA